MLRTEVAPVEELSGIPFGTSVDASVAGVPGLPVGTVKRKVNGALFAVPVTDSRTVFPQVRVGFTVAEKAGVLKAMVFGAIEP